MPVMAHRVARKPHGAGQRRGRNDEDRRHKQRADPRARIRNVPATGGEHQNRAGCIIYLPGGNFFHDGSGGGDVRTELDALPSLRCPNEFHVTALDGYMQRVEIESIPPAAPTRKKGPPPLSIPVEPVRKGAVPFSRIPCTSGWRVRRVGAAPLFPIPARGLKLTARSGTICFITREATNGQPPFRSPSFALAPGPRRPRSRRRRDLSYLFFLAPNAPRMLIILSPLPPLTPKVPTTEVGMTGSFASEPVPPTVDGPWKLPSHLPVYM